MDDGGSCINYTFVAPLYYAIRPFFEPGDDIYLC